MMRTSLKITNLILATFVLAMMSVSALAADPGIPVPATSEVSDQKAGSVLFYNFYSSNAAMPNLENTRINITNKGPENISVHLFFVASNCLMADAFLCLTPYQTTSFLMSDQDPNFSGYILAVATDARGVPINYNFLIGDEYVKLASGHHANLGAEAISALVCNPGVVSGDGTFVDILFNNAKYNRMPRVVAVSNFPSRVDGNDTLVVLNRTAGDMTFGGGATIGSIFVLTFDDAENVLSATLSGGCQLRFSISDSTPRTVPRLSTFIPAGRSGWMKLWAASDRGLLGSVINFNANAGAQAGAFNGGRNLHKLTLTDRDGYRLPIYPSHCPDGFKCYE